AARLGNTRRYEHQRNASGLLPQSELFPRLPFAELKAVIAPCHDYRVLGQRAGIERVEQPAELRVGKADRRQISLRGFPPFSIRGNPLVPPAAFLAHRLGGRRQPLAPVSYRRNLDFVERIEIEIFLRNEPGDVRFENTDAQK